MKRNSPPSFSVLSGFKELGYSNKKKFVACDTPPCDIAVSAHHIRRRESHSLSPEQLALLNPPRIRHDFLSALPPRSLSIPWIPVSADTTCPVCLYSLRAYTHSPWHRHQRSYVTETPRKRSCARRRSVLHVRSKRKRLLGPFACCSTSAPPLMMN